MRRLLVLLTALGLVAGCASSTAGNPSPQPGPASTAAASPPKSTTSSRPRELRLDNIDACSVLSPAQRAQFELDGKPLEGTSNTPIFAGRTCLIAGFGRQGVDVSFALATDSGIDALLAPGVVTDELTPLQIEGFPALVAKPKIVDFCSVDVDVAEGQLLDVQFRDGAKAPPIPQDELCKKAIEVAAAAIRTIQAT